MNTPNPNLKLEIWLEPCDEKLSSTVLRGGSYGDIHSFTRQYLLEKFNRTCAYCGAKNTPLEVEHIKPRSKGGSNYLTYKINNKQQQQRRIFFTLSKVTITQKFILLNEYSAVLLST